MSQVKELQHYVHSHGMPTKGRILLVASSPSVSKQTGWPIGFWAAELTHPLHVFQEAGYEIGLVSTEGGQLEMDGYSNPTDPSGYSAHDVISLGYMQKDWFNEMLSETKKLTEVNPEDYAAIFLVGGQGPMYTFRANPELEAEFLIDKQLGDLIRGRGTGDIRMLYDDKERFYLNGQYTIKSGEYIFSLPGINVLTQKITLDEGGKISWVGDPYNANLSLSGRIEKRISPAQLMLTSGASSGGSYPPTLIVSILNISGSLLRPQIGFDLQAPELANSTGSNSDVNAVIQRIRQDKDEVMRQSVALLIFGNFLPPSFSSGNPTSGNVISGAGVAGNSVSNIASTVMNDLFAKYGIPTRIQVNIADVRSRSGTASNAQVFVNSEWFLSDRLRLDLNYDPTVAMLVNSVAVPFNFNLEYMTRNENWRLKMFSRSSNIMLQQGGTTTNGVSGNTLGGGVVYRREFETFQRKKSPSLQAAEEKPVE